MMQNDSKPVHILYVEDDVGLARLFQKKLERVGYVVDLVYDGEMGLTQIHQQDYDIVALDFKLPGYDGQYDYRVYSLCAALRANQCIVECRRQNASALFTYSIQFITHGCLFCEYVVLLDRKT